MLKKYLNQDIDNPTYLFHGSPKKLSILKPLFFLIAIVLEWATSFEEMTTKQERNCQ